MNIIISYEKQKFVELWSVDNQFVTLANSDSENSRRKINMTSIIIWLTKKSSFLSYNYLLRIAKFDGTTKQSSH